jgi:hypothetical protein
MTTLVMDECNIQQVYAKEFMSDHLVRHKPFFFPPKCNQVFLVPYRLQMHWQLVVAIEVRKTRSVLPTAMQ